MTSRLEVSFGGEYRRGAAISSCTLYRYCLLRTWKEEGPLDAYLMLNPSTADGQIDDPTIRKCIGFSRRLGSRGFLVGNLFAFRATDPDALRDTPHFVGPESTKWLNSIVRKADRVIVAWGAMPIAKRRAREVFETHLRGREVFCLGRTASGAPRHPLMRAYSATLEPWSPP